MALGPEAFRDFFGSVPAAVAVVTTAGPDGRPLGFTCTAFSAVSLDPPQLLVCVDEGSRTLPAVLGAQAFALHLLDAEGARSSRAPSRVARTGSSTAWRGGAVSPCPRARCCSTGCWATRSARWNGAWSPVTTGC